ncbi:alpha/beta fold hydrolase [Alteromonadaceae bacterium M269]|nr:alpha/beta fold hydrolase [Alteromonadaceae bacterium M269]
MLRTVFWILWLIGISACSTSPENPLYLESEEGIMPSVSSYEEYVQSTGTWLAQNRVFVTDDKTTELKANTPYALIPRKPNGKGVLLIHGLGDSPYSFVDIGRELANRGFLVHTVLLPGHGSKPGDMLHVKYKQWRYVVEENIKLLQQDTSKVYLGGFSTGANLATELAIEIPEIEGLVLFSPAFKSNVGLDRYAGVASVFKHWLYKPSENADPHTNYARYEVVPSNAFAQFYKTSKNVRKEIEKHGYQKPTLMVMSEKDSVVDVNHVRTLFSEHFTHPSSRLIWYGSKQEEFADKRILQMPEGVPEFQVTNYSHMGLLFSPKNNHYGVEGDYRFCRNGQSASGYQQCKTGGDIWYSAWGTRRQGKVHARLTFNPQFEHMIQTMAGVVGAINPLDQAYISE